MTKKLAGLAVSEGLRQFWRPCRGLLAGARCPVMAGTWLVETVLLTVKATLFFSRGVEAATMTNRKSGKIFTFSLIALDPDNRLRYPPVSLFFMMSLNLQMARLVQENLFDARFLPDKVGC